LTGIPNATATRPPSKATTPAISNNIIMQFILKRDGSDAFSLLSPHVRQNNF
jgi:hypothetical protein